MTNRLARTVAVLAAAGLAVLVLHLLGVDVEGWFASLWDALTAVDPEYVVLGLVLQTLETLLSGLAWLAILRAAYPRGEVEALPVLTTYFVAVAANDVLPASLGTLVMLVMLTAIIPSSTFPGLVGGQVVHKLFFVAAGAFVYLYLFLSVPGSFSAELALLENHRALAVLVPAVLVIVAVVAIRAFWSRLSGLWERAKKAARSSPTAALSSARCSARVQRVALQARRDRGLPRGLRHPGDPAHRDDGRGRELARERRLRHAWRGRRQPGCQLGDADARGRRPGDRARVLDGAAADHDSMERLARRRARRHRLRLGRRQVTRGRLVS
ncbi:MAG TPA: hypothetical protein VEW90_04625 [Gaiellaceae bacterium]|nr:hypothetical protein [Gaiellaceae bacterium]